MENKYKQEPGADREIDDLFRKGLSGNQTNPPDYVWDKIDKKLLLREIFRLFFSFLSIAVVIYILRIILRSVIHVFIIFTL